MLDTSLFDGPLPVVVYSVAVALFLYLLLRRPTRTWLLTLLAALGAAVAIQTLTVLTIDYWLLPFGVPFEFRVWFWIGTGVATGCVALANLWNSPWWRKAAGVLGAATIILAAMLAVNATYGQYPTLRAAFGLVRYPELPPELQRAGTPPAAGQALWQSWVPPAGQPAAGRVFSATIPATTSGFPARTAAVYLPPAALVDQPPALPVLIALPGQPGDPTNLFTAGQLDQIMDRFSASHGGLAPIVVAPDQLGTVNDNPMCVDGPLGNSKTYLTVDVPRWIRATLPVSNNRLDWVIGGFSQGGTCSLQLGTGAPDLFGSFIDISGEEGPTLGDVPSTVDQGFSGNDAEYDAAQPLRYLPGRRFADTAAVLVVGELDPTFGPVIREVGSALEAAGVRVDRRVAAGTGHDWATARFGFRTGLDVLAARMGLQP